MGWLGTLIGAAIGGLLLESFAGVCFGAAIGFLAGLVNRQGRRIDALEAALKQARAAASAPVAATAPVAPAVAPSPAAVTRLLPAAAVPAEATRVPEPTSTAPVAPQAATSAATPRPAAPAAPRKPPVEMPAWARRLAGANTIVKVGLAMLFLGLVFLARFAAEHVTVPLELRLAGIGATGLVLLAVGWRLRLNSRAYALLMQGGGVAVTYLTLFAAVKLLGLEPLAAVFAAMLAVTLLTALLAIKQDAQALAVAAALGGYATPLLLSTGGGQIAVLLAYYLVLGAGVALVAWFKLWPRLNLIAFGFTALVASVWALDRYTPADYAMAQAFLLAFWVLFTAVLLMPGRKAQEPERWLQATLLFGVPVLGSGMQYGLLRPNASAIAVAALLIGAAYVALAAWVRKRAAHARVFEAFLALGAVFGTLVIPFALSAEATAGAWALEGAGALWLGLRQKRRLVVASGLALMLLGGLTLSYSLANTWPGSGAAHLALTQLLNALLLAAAGLLGGRFAHSLSGPRPMAPALVGWGTLWLTAAAVIVVDRWVPADHTWVAALTSVAAISGVLLGLQALWRWPGVAWPTAALLPAWTLMGVTGHWLHGAPLSAGGWWALPLAGAAQAVVLQRTAPHWAPGLRHLTHAGVLLSLALLGALQGSHWTADLGDVGSAWGSLGWLAAPAALLAAVLRQQRHAPEAQGWPLRLAPSAYARTGAGLLTLALVFWVLVANWRSHGGAQPLPYVPLLSPLELGIAAVLLAVTAWLRSASAQVLPSQPTLAVALPAGLAFLWINGMLIRAFHHWGDVPYDVDGWLASRGVQTGLALLWSFMALGLMWGAARRTQRGPWLTGAVLLGAVVLKLMLFDLQGSGTVLRIVSFIGVGVLMLVIGYVAPLPGSGDEPKKPA